MGGAGAPRGAAVLRNALARVPALSTPLGCDAVGVPEHHGFRLLARLPKPGCVFVDDDWWWWIVPAGSDHELAWPDRVRYAPGAYVPTARPRLLHWPQDSVPYTPPIPLYLMVCQLMGEVPEWA
ncbi:hypothetical protein [Streptomyces sp. NBC_01180]|uniref:hypothetical protein n=1 Tax=unclassified Streptomyces TaxID=2593676 RepID=UPI003869C58F